MQVSVPREAGLGWGGPQAVGLYAPITEISPRNGDEHGFQLLILSVIN